MPTLPCSAGRLPPSLGQLAALNVLNLGNNKMTGEDRRSALEAMLVSFEQAELTRDILARQLEGVSTQGVHFPPQTRFSFL